MARGPRQLFNHLRGQPSPAGYDVTACLNIELGCNDCPAHRSLMIPGVAEAQLEMPSNVPITTSMDVRVEGTGRAEGYGLFLRELGHFAVNTKSCSGGTVCPNVDGIESAARAFETNADVAASVVDLPVLHLDVVNKMNQIIT